MASTYTTDLAIQLMATGEQAGQWGKITNTNLVVVQQAIAGYESISIAGGAQTTALVMTQNALATARNAVIKLTGTITGNQVVTVPNGIEKTWIVSNGTTGAFTVQFKYASTGTGQTWSTTDKGIKILYADGSDIQLVDLSTLSGTIATAQIANNAITTAKLDTGAVTAVKITQSTITQSKLAANSVGANQLISTGVTAATYTVATITVDADGRITSASSGAAGGGDFLQTVYESPATFTMQPTTKALRVTVIGGGGGSCPRNQSTGSNGGGGGGGGFAQEYLDAPAITGPVSVTVGTGGANTPSPTGTGGTGGTSSFGAFLSATGGQGNNRCATAGTGGSGSGGQINLDGQRGQDNFGGAAMGWFGGQINYKRYTFGDQPQGTGLNGFKYGGGANQNCQGSYAAGGNGAGGVVIVEEYF